MRATAPEDPAPAPRREQAGLRLEVQALRAVAVGLVVAFHLFPDAVPGGFVGVDVFFAISGFLITSLLLREAERSGRVSLAGFWARRARRILPAALLVILATAIATIALVPLNRWEQYFAEMQASVAYVQNWHLAGDAVDYFAASQDPSPVQHYWSLSVEEQFYVVWPLLILAALDLTRGRARHVRRRAIAAGMLLLTGVSLAYAIAHTASDPGEAYFITPTRAWEFGLGGLLALAPAGGGSRGIGRAVLSWAGLAAILVAAFAFTENTPFPGTAALLPILGAVAVMGAGMPQRRWSPAPLLRLRPVQWLGDVSYSVYLWHWPLLVLAPYALGRAVGTGTAFAIAGLTLVLSALTKRLVEDPVRAGRLLAGRPTRWTFAAAAAATVAVFAVALGASGHVRGEIRDAEQATRDALAHRPKCFGAASRDPGQPCRNPELEKLVVPAPIEAPKVPNAPCTVVERHGRAHVCEFGTRDGAANGSIALVGDSHAAHWRAAVQEVARARGWRGLSLTYTSCPLTKGRRAIPEPARSRCAQFQREVFAYFEQHPEVHTVFVSALAGGSLVRPGRGQSRFDAAVDGYVAAWRALPSSVRRIVVLRDNPKAGKGADECVTQAIADGEAAGPACAISRAEALDPDPAAEAVRRMRDPRVHLVDLTDAFCDRARCYPVVGGALVHRDQDHMTPVFAQTLGPLLQRAVDGLA